MLGAARKFLSAVGKIELATTVAILAIIVGIVLCQVFSRYVLGRPLIWAEELATYLMIWLGFVAASVAYKMRRHISIQTYDSFVSPSVRRLATALIHAVVLAALVTVTLYVPDAMRTERLQSTVGLPVNVGLHWFFTVPTLVACLSMSLTAVFYICDAIWGSGAALLDAHTDPSLSDDIISDFQAGSTAQ